MGALIISIFKAKEHEKEMAVWIYIDNIVCCRMNFLWNIGSFILRNVNCNKITTPTT